MTVIPAPPSTVVKIETALRKTAAISIDIENPLDRQVTFQVKTQGMFLTCDRQVSLNANESTKFVVLFTPLSIGRSSGNIKFENEEIGEIWHQLELNCVGPSPIQLDQLTCAAGSQVYNEFGVIVSILIVSFRQ